MLNRRHAAGLLAALAVLAAPQSFAQSYPSKPIRWVVPYPAGGGSDFLARTIGQQLSTQIGQTVTIDNKPGANTAIGASDVARSPADGYTVLSADNGTMVFNSALYSKLTYNPDKDLVPVTLMGRFPMILVVGPNSDIRDAKDFVAKAKANPGKISYGSAGAGSPHHLAMELIKVTTGAHMVHIPYRGAAPALTDLAGGQVNAMMVDLAAGAGFTANDLDLGLLSAFTSDTERQRAVLQLVQGLAYRDPGRALAIADANLTTPALREQAERVIEAARLMI